MRRAFLIGAGFSYDLGMPLASEVTDTFLRTVTPEGARRVAGILAEQEPYGEGRPINGTAIREGIELLVSFKQRNGTNYEAFLSSLEAQRDHPGQSQTNRDSYHFLFSVFYDQIFGVLFAYQTVSFALMYERNKNQYSSLKALAAATPTWIFSLNHDLYVECLAIDLGIPITYGDSKALAFPISNRDLTRTLELTCSKREELTKGSPHWYAGDAAGINLVRLHGGVSEHEYKDGSLLCNPSLRKHTSRQLLVEALTIESMGYYFNDQRAPSGRDRIVTGPSGDPAVLRRTVLTGGSKYSTTTNFKKGEEKLGLFTEVLEEVDEIVVIGYSFGDVHINNRLLNAMARNDNLHLWIIDPAGRPTPPFLEQFDYNLRLRGAACRAAEGLGYLLEEKWNDTITKELRRNEAHRADVKRAVHAVLGIHSS